MQQANKLIRSNKRVAIAKFEFKNWLILACHVCFAKRFARYCFCVRASCVV